MLYLIQANTINNAVFLGTVGMLILSVGLVIFIVFYQRKMILNQRQKAIDAINLQKKIIQATLKMQEEERLRIAADLHDDAGPLLSTSKLIINEGMAELSKEDLIDSIRNARELIDSAIILIRNLSHELMPPSLKRFGLRQAIIDTFKKISSGGAIETECDFEQYQGEFNKQTESMLFRSIQEILNNMLKHSNPTFIQFKQEIVQNAVYIEMLHDGEGLTQELFNSLKLSSQGLGLNNIQNRIDAIQGTLSFLQDPVSNYYIIKINVPITHLVAAEAAA